MMPGPTGSTKVVLENDIANLNNRIADQNNRSISERE
jgi:hypothetical protein